MRSYLLAGLLLASLAFPALAQDYRLGALSISHPWTRATAAPGAVGGGYLVIRNTGSEADRLLRVESPAAGTVELHTMSMEGGVMRMRPLAGGIPIPAGAEVRLEPAGLHVMFLQTRQRFERNQRIPARLVFERAGAIDIEFAVEAPGAPAGGHGH